VVIKNSFVVTYVMQILFIELNIYFSFSIYERLKYNNFGIITSDFSVCYLPSHNTAISVINAKVIYFICQFQ